jgi:hypothetical protein
MHEILSSTRSEIVTLIIPRQGVAALEDHVTAARKRGLQMSDLEAATPPEPESPKGHTLTTEDRQHPGGTWPQGRVGKA